MRVMLVDDNPDRMAALERALVAGGHVVAARLAATDDLLGAVAQAQPDIVLIEVDEPGRDTLESLGRIARDRPRPIVLFTQFSDTSTIRRAIRAGVSAYVVDSVTRERLHAVIEVAIAQFQEFQGLKAELSRVQTKLADRRDVEIAKGLLMQRRGLEEEVAYSTLRRMAMDRNLPLGDLARSLMAAAAVL